MPCLLTAPRARCWPTRVTCRALHGERHDRVPPSWSRCCRPCWTARPGYRTDCSRTAGRRAPRTLDGAGQAGWSLVVLHPAVTSSMPLVVSGLLMAVSMLGLAAAVWLTRRSARRAARRSGLAVGSAGRPAGLPQWSLVAGSVAGPPPAPTPVGAPPARYGQPAGAGHRTAPVPLSEGASMAPPERLVGPPPEPVSGLPPRRLLGLQPERQRGRPAQPARRKVRP